jgi:hypothetical protein
MGETCSSHGHMHLSREFLMEETTLDIELYMKR